MPSALQRLHRVRAHDDAQALIRTSFGFFLVRPNTFMYPLICRHQILLFREQDVSGVAGRREC